jgi:heat shock protein HslJ
MRILFVHVWAVLVCAMLVGACAREVAPTVAPARSITTAGLLNTYWRLAELDGQQIVTPAGARELHVVLNSANQRVSGFSGCNRLMGGYVLAGDSLKFDQIAGTLMACAGDMDLEKRFLAAFPRVARWEISGETLRWLDGTGKTLATFQARRDPPVS